MYRVSFSLIAVFLYVFAIVGCGGGEGNNPLEPSVDQDSGNGLTQGMQSAGQSQPLLWGYYDLIFDFENETVGVIPNRGAMYTVNVVKFLNMNPAWVSISDFTIDVFPDHYFTQMNITITHPLDDAKFDGYDVRGVFIGNGSEPLSYDGSIIHFNEDFDQECSADGYTRWFNPTEFGTQGVFGSTPGVLASAGYAGTATINPYRYFGEGIGAQDSTSDYLDDAAPQNGYFLHGTSNTRFYEIGFPRPDPGIKYGYAVTANWAGGSPANHPAHAPESVGFYGSHGWNAYYVDASDNGGHMVLFLRIFDWHSSLTSGVMEDYRIVVNSPMQSAPYICDSTDMTPYFSEGQWQNYYVTIPADNLTSNEMQYVWILIEYPGYDYSNPLGIPSECETETLTTYYRTPVYPLSVPPDPSLSFTYPNGGEIFNVGEPMDITWNTHHHAGRVDISYYKDNDPSTLYPIAENLADVGDYRWESVPDDPSEQVRIRISSQLYPGLYDDSDSDFTIAKPEIVVTSPNGGEKLEIGEDFEINWTSEYLTGNVEIYYSKDNFVSDAHLIGTDIPDTGIFNWMNIPDDPSQTVRLRIRSVDNHSIFDDSDDDFAIEQGVTGWAHRDSWNYDAIAYRVDRDGQDNAYFAGARDGLSGSPYGVLSKFNESGFINLVIWTTEGEFDDFICYDLAVSSMGYVYVVGSFEGSADFDPGPGTVTDTSNGGSDAFMLQLDTDLAYQDHWTWGGDGSEAAKGIFIDAYENKYVTGWFGGTTVDFDPGTGTEFHSNNGSVDAYLSMFEWNDAHSWTQTWGGSGVDHGKSVTYRDSIYVTGDFESTVDFDPSGGTVEFESEGYSDVFLTSFSTGGVFNWASAWGGADIDSGEDLDCDLSGNVFVAGGFNDIVDFDPDAVDQDIHIANLSDAYICRYSPSGDYQFALTWSGSSPYEIAHGIEIDSSNYLYVTGQAFAYEGPMTDFDPYAGEDLHPALGAYLMKFDGSGVYYWTRTWGSGDMDSETAGYGVHGADRGAVFAVGTFDGTGVDFAPSGAPCNETPFLLDSFADLDMFIVKYRSDGCW